jgi:hypothetical protein
MEIVFERSSVCMGDDVYASDDGRRISVAARGNVRAGRDLSVFRRRLIRSNW